MNDTIARLQPIFRTVLEAPGLVLTNESNASNVPGWDSLAHVNLMSAVEREFKVRFALGELAKLQNVGDLVALIEKKARK